MKINNFRGDLTDISGRKESTEGDLHHVNAAVAQRRSRAHHSCWRAAIFKKMPFPGGPFSKRPRARPGPLPAFLIWYFSKLENSSARNL